MTTFEQAVIHDATEFLPKLGFDPQSDDLETLGSHAREMVDRVQRQGWPVAT